MNKTIHIFKKSQPIPQKYPFVSKYVHETSFIKVGHKKNVLRDKKKNSAEKETVGDFSKTNFVTFCLSSCVILDTIKCLVHTNLTVSDFFLTARQKNDMT